MAERVVVGVAPAPLLLADLSDPCFGDAPVLLLRHDCVFLRRGGIEQEFDERAVMNRKSRSRLRVCDVEELTQRRE